MALGSTVDAHVIRAWIFRAQKLAAPARARLRDAYYARGDYVAVDEIYRRKLELEPENAWAEGNYASFLLQRGKIDEGIAMAQRAVAQLDYGIGRQTLARGYTMKGVHLLWGTADANEAKALFERALKVDPNHETAHYALGAFYMRTGAPKEAKRSFERAAQLDPKDELAKQALALVR